MAGCSSWFKSGFGLAVVAMLLPTEIAFGAKQVFELTGAEKMEYKVVGDSRLHLHVFRPENWRKTDHRAAIVFFFGGGWSGGTPEQFAPQCRHLANLGMVAIAAEYRVASRDQAHPRDCVADAKDAVRWMRTHARSQGIDGARIAVSGGSAGGHLAACTATISTQPDEREATVHCTPNALVLYNAVYDTSPSGFGSRKMGDQMFALSPIHHIQKRMPPTLIFHGQADTTVPFENAARFERLMKEAGNACQLVAYPQSKHGFFNQGREGSQYEDTTRRLEAFLTKLGFLPPSNGDFLVAGRTLSQWQEELGEGNDTRRRRAARSLGQFGVSGLAANVAMLDDADPAVRYIAAANLGDLGSGHDADETVFNKLRTLLLGNSRAVRLAAAYAMCRMEHCDVGLPVLEEMLAINERGLQCSLADFLGRIGKPAAPLLKAIAAKQDDQDYHVKNAFDFAKRYIEEDEAFIEYRRPQGGANPGSWRPGEQLVETKARQFKRPNILWISCEDISPNLGCYGDDYASTPNLDELARQGLRFEHAFTPAGVCAIVRSSLITGVYAISQGTQHMRANVELPNGLRCFPEYLRSAGYFCTNKSKTDYQFAPPPTAWDRQGNKHNDWRDREPGQPFFSVINLTISHESQIRHGEATHQKLLARLSTDQRHDPDEAAKYLPPIQANTPETRKDWAWYSDNISEMDRQVGLILQQLEDDGLADNTIVVYWSDHGRGLPRAKRWIYDSGVHVPMIVRWPGQLAAGTVRNDLVSTQDLPPTMLSLAGVDVPGYMQGRIMLGDDRQPEPDYLFFHRDRMDETYELMRAARDHRYKYIRNYHHRRSYAQPIQYMNMMPTLVDLRKMSRDGELNFSQSLFFRHEKPLEELYDLEKDPHETVNLAWLPEHAVRIASMRTALESWQDQVTDLGLVPEPVQMEQMRPDDLLRRVAEPRATWITKGRRQRLQLVSETEGASLQYRAKGKQNAWQLYSGPVAIQARQIEVMACRAGFRSSRLVLVSKPSPSAIPKSSANSN